MKNHEIEAAWGYHNGTKHSYQSVHSSKHYLDWENQPIPFKIYPALQPIALPEHLASSQMPALLAISATATAAEQQAELTLQTLAEILFLSAGITRRRKYIGGEILFRAAACTGALYHIDLYIICCGLADLEAGVYQFSPQDFALRRLRAGDHRAVLVNASGEELAMTRAPCIVVSASTFWRNAWKYQSRAYRHCYWDNGTMLANMLAAAAARKIPTELAIGFVDTTVSRLLGLDVQREAPLSLIALGQFSAKKIEAPQPIAPLMLETTPLSKREVDYPAMRSMHEASSLENEAEVIGWRDEAAKAKGEKIKDNEQKENRVFSIQPLDDERIPQDSIEEVIVRRGSTREFARESITFEQLSTILDRATRGIAADVLNPTSSMLNELYLIVHAVEGLPSGAYVFRPQQGVLVLLKEGDFRRDAGYLGLNQSIPADCSVNVYFLVDLDDVLKRFGNRGYRAAQLEAAIMGGKLYLAAYAQRLGASGLTFYDDDVTDFFSPQAMGKSVMFLVALGKSVKRPA